MIVLMAGLPGTGKTTLARELARLTHGSVLSKDEIRATLFSPDDIEYSTAQDEFVMEVMLQAVRFLLQKQPGRNVFLDGRTFSRRYQIDRLRIRPRTQPAVGDPRMRLLRRVCPPSARPRTRSHSPRAQPQLRPLPRSESPL
jgi:hypothetical protein